MNNFYIVLHSAFPYILSLFVLGICFRLLKKQIKRKFKTNNKMLIVNFFVQLFSCLIYFFIIISILSCFFPIKNFMEMIMTGSGLIVVVLTFISQEAISNMINGMLIILSNSFKIDDIVTIPEHNIVGRIWNITLHHTEIMNFENNKVIVPNKIMNNAVIERKRIQKDICNFLTFYINYDADIDLVEKISKEITRNHRYYIDIRTPEDIENGKEDIGFTIMSFDERGVLVRISVWSKAENGFYLCCELRRQLLNEFKKHGIKFPHTQIDIHNVKDIKNESR